MTVQEFYAAVDGDYSSATAIFRTDERICKFLKKYEKDPSFSRLCAAVETDDPTAAFEAAHAMKGNTGMFYLMPLYRAVTALVEQLRAGNVSIDRTLFDAVVQEQHRVIELIPELEGVEENEL